MKPINFIRLGILMLIPVFSHVGLRAQGLHLTSGVNWVVNGAPYLVLNNAGLTNNGNFFADSSTVLFCGNVSTSGSFIGGGRPIPFYNLTISKSSNDVELNNNATVTGGITMDGGNLQLNRYSIDLGSSGRIIGERNSSCITGIQGGTIKITTVLNAPHAVNPGNIGVEFTSDANLGTMVITRGHDPRTNSAGTISIQRWFNIARETNTNISANLRFFYLERELAGEDKNALTVFSAKEKDYNWSMWGKDASDPMANWILKGGILSGHFFTLAKTSGPSSLTSTGLIAAMQVYPNPSRNAFSLRIIGTKEGYGVFQLCDASGRLLEEKKAYLQEGVNSIDWDISKYAAGVYYLSLRNQYGGTLNIVKQ